MTYFYPGDLQRKKYDLSSGDMGERFKALGEIVEMLIEAVDPPVPEDYEVAGALRAEMKKERQIDGLHFLRSKEHQKYYCVTSAKFAALERKFRNLEITEPYDIDQMMQYGRIEFPELNKTYWTIEELKHDWLALKLSGIEQ